MLNQFDQRVLAYRIQRMYFLIRIPSLSITQSVIRFIPTACIHRLYRFTPGYTFSTSVRTCRCPIIRHLKHCRIPRFSNRWRSIGDISSASDLELFRPLASAGDSYDLVLYSSGERRYSIGSAKGWYDLNHRKLYNICRHGAPFPTYHLTLGLTLLSFDEERERQVNAHTDRC